MVAPTPTPPPTSATPSRPTANHAPAFASSRSYHCSGWISLLSLSILVLGLLAGVLTLSSGGLGWFPQWPWGSIGSSLPPTQAGQVSTPASPPMSTSTKLAPAVPCTARDTGAFRQNLTIGPDQHVCGNVVVFDGNVTVQGIVDGNVTVAGGMGIISGTVNGSVTALDANLHLLTGAFVSGSVQVVGGSVQRDPGSSVGGSIDQGIDPRHVAIPNLQGFGGSYDFPWSHLLFWVLASIAIAALFPRHLALVRRAARDSLPTAFFVGVLCAVLGAILALVLFVSCLGIPLALLVAVAAVVASVVGTVALGLWLGERLLGQSSLSRRASLFPAMVGVTLLALAQTIPCVGGVLTVVTTCAGLGASVLALLYARRHAVWTPDGLL